MSKLHVPTGSHEHGPTAGGHEDTKTTKSTKKDHKTLMVFRVPLSVLSGLCGLHAMSRRLVYLTALVTLSAACVTTTGEPVVIRTPLEVPPAPPRVITPLPLPEPPTPVEELVEDPATEKPPTPPKPKPAPNNSKPPDAKQEPPPIEPVPPVAPPPAPTGPPPPTLSTPPQGDANALFRQIRDNIERTRRTLEKVNYGPLSNDRKKAYDDAKLFATQAEDALKVSNLVFAKELADKAERLAKELQGR